MDKEKYIEVEVPVRQDAQWFKQLRAKMAEQGVNVKWQNGHFHITVAFITDHPQFANLFLPMTHSVAWKVGPFLTFDKVDAFTTRSGQHIVYLTSTNPTPEFMDMVRRIREEFKAVGCEFSTDFKLHVTLGRVEANQISLDALQRLLAQVTIPAFTLQLFNVNTLYYPSHDVYNIVSMYPDEKTAKDAYEERRRQAFRNAGSNFQLFADPDM